MGFVIIASLFLHFIFLFYFLIFYRRKVYVKLVEKMVIFWAVKLVLILIMPSACCQYRDFLFLAAGNVLIAYVFFNGFLELLVEYFVWVVSSWLRVLWQVGHLSELDKILDCEMRPRTVNDSDASKLGSNQVMMKHYLVKWKGRSYLHCIW